MEKLHDIPIVVDPLAYFQKAGVIQKSNVAWALRKYDGLIRSGPEDQVLHIECGCGDITLRMIHRYLGKYGRIVATDTDSELIGFAKDFNGKPSIDYTTELNVAKGFKVLPKSLQSFDKVFCFSCHTWTRDADKALENTRYLLKEKGECLFSFVGDSPVYDTYERLSKYSKWAMYMKDFRLVIPFTHCCEKAHFALAGTMRRAGFQVLKCSTSVMDIKLERDPASTELVREHIREVNQFIGRVPTNERPYFVEDCLRLLLSDLQTEQSLYYKLVMAYARNPSEIPRIKINVKQGCSSRREPEEEPWFIIESCDIPAPLEDSVANLQSNLCHMAGCTIL